jgi:hypothetical protein
MEYDNDNIIISNIENYNISFYNGNMILTKKVKKNKLQLEELNKYNFAKSKIIKCKIDNNCVELNKYLRILFFLYKLIDNRELILNNTKLNIVDNRYEDKGFKYLEQLNISIQRVDSNKSLQEIIHITNICNIKLELEIELEDGKHIFI